MKNIFILFVLMTISLGLKAKNYTCNPYNYMTVPQLTGLSYRMLGADVVSSGCQYDYRTGLYSNSSMSAGSYSANYNMQMGLLSNMSSMFASRGLSTSSGSRGSRGGFYSSSSSYSSRYGFGYGNGYGYGYGSDGFGEDRDDYRLGDYDYDDIWDYDDDDNDDDKKDDDELTDGEGEESGTRTTIFRLNVPGSKPDNNSGDGIVVSRPGPGGEDNGQGGDSDQSRREPIGGAQIHIDIDNKTENNTYNYNYDYDYNIEYYDVLAFVEAANKVVNDNLEPLKDPCAGMEKEPSEDDTTPPRPPVISPPGPKPPEPDVVKPKVEKISVVQNGARKVLSIFYGTCNVLEKAVDKIPDPSLDLEKDSLHSVDTRTFNREQFNEHIKNHPYRGYFDKDGNIVCGKDRRQMPIFGIGKPKVENGKLFLEGFQSRKAVKSNDVSHDEFTMIDCSGFVMASLYASGVKLNTTDRNPPNFNNMNTRKMIESMEKNSSCFETVTLSKDNSELKPGDVMILSGSHSLIVDNVGADPLGLIENEGKCHEMDPDDLDFEAIQSLGESSIGPIKSNANVSKKDGKDKKGFFHKLAEHARSICNGDEWDAGSKGKPPIKVFRKKEGKADCDFNAPKIDGESCLDKEKCKKYLEDKK